ncbi:protein DpdJ [Paenibacillus sp. LS1]|nr:protein DpdJ [Paenibacillus sp. LS1]
MDWKQLFLNELEEQEARYLSWGYVEGSFTEEELNQRVTEFIEKYQVEDMSADELKNELYEERMISSLPGRDGEIWRTRMAETVRLLFRLRQWFPSKKWENAPTLVSDFRFNLRTREYPKRFIDGSILLQELKDKIEPYELDALKSFMEGKGDGFLLSEFQRNATARMLQDLQEEKSRGFIVTAGTGTGKTLSFYLPALSWIASRIDDTQWTKAIALYPRNELLKDQFTDTLNEIRDMNQNMQLARPISIGAVFGDTPVKKDSVIGKWDKGVNGFICPYLKCPICQSDLAWSTTDHAIGQERLVCTKRGCATVIEGNVMPLTRESMKKSPPDILFTTTEMMNRYMSDYTYSRLIGLNVDQPPRIVLLDEVHTYTGTHGAQVALLLRRWHYALGKTPVEMVGLSATLREAGDFFSDLTGLNRSDIFEVEASKGLMESKGKEYQLILRGDPASGTSLMSTTIQAAMLLRRMLDPRKAKSQNVSTYGSKLFLFADDLDVTNRLYHTMLDAEGRNSKTKEKRRDKEPLAALRSYSSAGFDGPMQMRSGQTWLFAEEIGHDLQQSLIIGRTSSQDSGVDANAEVIVSSPSLEVGFNDKQVGAVIQHKAPRGLAAFLQRKGRAGRDPSMRPWMVTILSDFGRDRFMYQSYETLFQPVLERQALPIMNRYVMRIQAVFTFMDWVAYELGQQKVYYGSLWYMFAQPQNDDKYLSSRSKVIQLIKNVLEDKSSFRSKMEIYIRKALDCSIESMQSLMWEPPRSLMLEVLPTLLRRLETNWASLDGDQEMATFGHPLPDFVPANLFTDLSLPEVKVVLPSSSIKPRPEEPMDILQALNTFAPGRVSRRFGVSHGAESHWIEPASLKSSVEPQKLLIGQFCQEGEYRHLGFFQYFEGDTCFELPVLRPWKIRPKQSDGSIDTKSNARMIWRSQISPNENNDFGEQAIIPKGSRWASLIEEVRFFTHDNHSWVNVRRFTTGSDASVRLINQSDPVELSIQFALNDDQPAALGFIQQVDGIRFTLSQIPDNLISLQDRNEAKMRSFRSLYFQHIVVNDPVLKKVANIFVLERMAEIYLSALLQVAMSKTCPLEEACEFIHNQNFSTAMDEVMNVVFQVLSNSPNESDMVEEDGEDEQYQRTHLKLIGLFEIPEVADRLKNLASVLWQNPNNEWEKWARQRWVSTLGEAILSACNEMASSHRNSELLLDVGGGSRQKEDGSWENADDEIWITETIDGGSGIIEEIANNYQRDPRRFYRLIESALSPSDAEIVHSELSQILEKIQNNGLLSERIKGFRHAKGYHETNRAMEDLRKQLQDLGILTTLPVMNGLFNRILRPGSNPETDQFLFSLLQLWQQEETRLGIEMDARVFAYISSADGSKTNDIHAALQHIDPLALNDMFWRFNVVYSLIWPQGSQIRRRALESYNPFTINPPTDRELVLDAMLLHHRIQIPDPNWKQKTSEMLIEQGSVQILIPVERKLEISNIIFELTEEPIDLGYLHVFPRVEGITRGNNFYTLNVEIREALQ